MSTFNYDSSVGSIENWELGLVPRLITAGWFAVAACIPVAFFFLVFGGIWSNSLQGVDLRSVWFFGGIPISAAALLGFSVGYRIVDPFYNNTAGGAALRGTLVSFLSYVLFMAAYGALAALSTGSPQTNSLENSLGMLLVVFLFGLFYVGWLILIAGAVAGWLLFLASDHSVFHKYVINSPKVTVNTAYCWTALAILLYLANCGLLLFTTGQR
jgi:hypothetical protein